MVRVRQADWQAEVRMSPFRITELSPGAAAGGADQESKEKAIVCFQKSDLTLGE